MIRQEFEETAIQYTPMIFHLLKKLNITSGKEEFFQSALLALWEASLKADPEKGSLDSYYYHCMKGTLLNELSSNSRWNSGNFLIGQVPENAAEYKENGQLFVLDQLQRFRPLLTEKQYKWLAAYTLYGLTVKDIAAMEGTTEAAVKSWKKGALKAIRK